MPQIRYLGVQNLQQGSAHSEEEAIPQHLGVEARLDQALILQWHQQRLEQDCLVSPPPILAQEVHLEVVVGCLEASLPRQVSEPQQVRRSFVFITHG